ncbi:MAG: tetratricopeptide repeat protein [Victivallales bacterium]|nr:tetratricopeptide repeat protein [Victivallales bacterium]
MKKSKTLLILLLVLGVVIVLGLSAMMGVMAYRRQKQTFLFKQGEEAYKNGDYELAKQKLKAYTRRDPSHEQSWLYLADIYERQLLWRDAAMIWKRLVNLNVLNNDYVKHNIYANYHAHDFGTLDKIFSNLSMEKQREYFEIYALTQFFQHTNTDATDRLVAMLPQDGIAAQMVRVFKHQGPIPELEKLENCDDPVIQVEALMQDAFISEYRTKDLKRAEDCLRKAAKINPDLCRAPLGDFLFRNARYKDAYEIYKTVRPQMMTVGNIINYAEVLFLSKDAKALSDLENEVHHKRRSAILLRAYIQSLQAYLGKDTQAMIKNYRVAQIHRTTPVGLLLSYAVAIDDSDIPLMVSVLSQWRKTKIFKEKQAEILANTRKMLATALEDDKLEDAAKLAQMFLSKTPPELLCWQIVVLDQMKRGTITEKLLQDACKLFPKESFFQTQRLRLEFSKGDRQGILDIYDQMIATSNTPIRERYRKVLYLERQRLLDNAFQELQTMMKEDTSLVSAKHCLGFGIRTGKKEALNAAAAFPELAEIAQFEMERRYGDLDKATKC